MLKKQRWNKSFYCVVALALMTAVIFLAAGAPSIVRTSKTDRELPIYCVQRDDKCVSLTFDAAWGDVRVRQSYSQGSSFSV